MYDQEGRNGLGLSHWVAYGIDGATTSLPEGAGDGQRAGIVGGSIFFTKDHTMAAARQRGPGPTTTCSRLSQWI